MPGCGIELDNHAVRYHTIGRSNPPQRYWNRRAVGSAVLAPLVRIRRPGRADLHVVCVCGRTRERSSAGEVGVVGPGPGEQRARCRRRSPVWLKHVHVVRFREVVPGPGVDAVARQRPQHVRKIRVAEYLQTV